MSYFTPAANANVNNSRGHSQVSSHHTSFSSPSFGGGYTQLPPPTKKSGFIPPPVGAMQSSGQTVLDCPHCREILPPGLNLATHLIGCGAAALLTSAFTPFDYPSRPQRAGGRPPNF